MTRKVSQENMQAMFPIGLKILFDGCLTNAKFLCDGYVMSSTDKLFNSLIINTSLCDVYVISNLILFDYHPLKHRL